MAELVMILGESDFNPLPSHEGRRSLVSILAPRLFISIHSPHTRGDIERHAEKAE